MIFSDIYSLVEEKCDGRSFGIAKHQRWADLVRSEVSHHALAGGFHGLYFLYKEADVIGGSIAGQARYALPDDYVDDLSLWYNGTSIIKAQPNIMNLTMGSDESSSKPSGEPAWFVPRGLEFEFIPATPEDGKPIAMFYNGVPDSVVGADFTDYFMRMWSALHVFGMAEHALDSVGGYSEAKNFRQRFMDELQRLMMDNRRFWLKGTKIRLQNWDEYTDQKRFVFPQFSL